MESVATPVGGPFPEHTVETFLKYSVMELLLKRKFTTAMIIKPLRRNPEWASDPRQPRALAYYLEERRLINEALRQKRGAPENQAVGLQPLTMTGKGV